MPATYRQMREMDSSMSAISRPASDNRYVANARTDDRTQAYLGANYLLNRKVGFTLAYDYLKQDSAGAAAGGAMVGEPARSDETPSWMARIGYIFAKSAFDALKAKMDPRRANGGVFLGLEGIVIKSHGSSGAEGFAAAIKVGYDMVRNGLNDKIAIDLKKYRAHQAARAAQQA